MKEEFDENIKEFEAPLQKMASEIASGAVYEKLPPQELLNKTEAYITRLNNLTERAEEIMFTLKPSPLIDAILNFKKASEAKAQVISIQAKEGEEPLLKYVLSRIDNLWLY